MLAVAAAAGSSSHSSGLRPVFLPSEVAVDRASDPNALEAHLEQSPGRDRERGPAAE